MEATKKLISNFIKTLKVSDKSVKYSLVTFGESGKVLVTFKKSTEKDFSLEELKLDKVGGLRNVDEALKLVDQEVFGARLGFPEKVIKGTVFVFTTGKFNERRVQELSSAVDRLLQRNLDTVFVDSMAGVIDKPLGNLVTNISTTNPRTLPALLSKLSTQIGRIPGV